MAFSDNLTHLQKEHGESNYRLAKNLSVSPTTIKNWQEGKLPSVEQLLKLANHYGCAVDVLLRHDGTEVVTNAGNTT